MNVVTPKRVFAFAALLFMTSAAFAANPSPRAMARMVFDEEARVGVLFGGRGPVDGATQVAHSSDETWLWTGSRWVQRFPIVRPAGRAAHTMVYDSDAGRAVLFGGRAESAEPHGVPILFNDTWLWDDEQWTRVETASAPSPRHFSGAAYDPLRDRVVLFGGNVAGPDGRKMDPVFDTWEFDGSSWTQVGAPSGPEVAKPVLAFDRARNEIIMMGISDEDLSPLMYRYDAATHGWTRITPETMPPCGNDGYLEYVAHRGVLVWFGGTCATGTPPLNEMFEWDGTNWSKLETSPIARMAGLATMYDPVRRQIVTYGGMPLFSTQMRSLTHAFSNGKWRYVGGFSHGPSPRSLSAFTTDPKSNAIWLIGGLAETAATAEAGVEYVGDFWGFRDGQWFPLTVPGMPDTGCDTPLGAYDKDRDRLVVTCGGAFVLEWDGATWTSFSELKTLPPVRRFANMVYDEKLKKTVLFGGYSSSGYRQDTWLWNGAAWTELKLDRNQKPEHRALMAMWYDPHLQKTVLYGGLGRPDIDTRIARYSDMWSFDGTRWTKMNVTETPGERFGPQIAVNPTSGKLLLFGGLRSETVGENQLTQYYTDDTWEWNGADNRWTRLTPARSPARRENGMLAWDPVGNRMVLFGGYSGGFFLSDVWYWDGATWTPVVEHGGSGRRRVVGRSN